MDFIAQYWWLWLVAWFASLVIDLVFMWLFASREEGIGCIAIAMFFHVLAGILGLVLLISIAANMVLWVMSLGGI